MIHLETLIELKFVNLLFEVNFSIRVVEAYPLIEIRQAGPHRAIRGNNISVNSTLSPLKCEAGHVALRQA